MERSKQPRLNAAKVQMQMSIGEDNLHLEIGKVISGSVCKVRTQDTDNFDEEVKPLASAR